MRHQQLEQILKKYKASLSPELQALGVQTWRALKLPLAAVLERRSIVHARQIVWPVAEVADCDSGRILGPAAGEAMVKVAFTMMSPGTERAQLLGLTNPRINFPYSPGYSGSGEVVFVGRKVSGFKIGDRVAGRIKHASLGVVEAQGLFRIPPEVSLEPAALIELGIIVLQGIRKACIKPGESVLVLGQGLIGQLANRLCRIAGGAPIVAVATSRSRAARALGKGGADEFFTVEELNCRGVNNGFDVVIEATGDGKVLPFANSLARAGGRVVLLGSPRSLTSLNLGQGGCQPGLTLIGAHISGMPQRDRSHGQWTYRDEGQLFLDLLAQGRLSLDDLVTHRCVPSQAGEIYESLRVGDSGMITAIFDWSRSAPNGIRFKKERDTPMQQIVSSSLRLSKRLFGWKVDFKEKKILPTTPHNRLLRIGVVGGGDFGLKNAKGIQATRAACVTAAFDSNPIVLKDLARQLNAPPVPDYESLLARPDVDAVLLSVPHMLHAPLAIQAAQAGKHVLLEKPMGVNLQDATRIVESCHKAGVRLTVNFSFRYLPILQVVRELIREDILGKVCGIEINHLMFKGASYWAGGYTGRSPSSWRASKEKAGGGILIMGLCHAIDYLRYATGLEVKRVFSEYGTFASPVEGADTIAVNCQYDNGAVGSTTASTCWRGTPSQQVRIWGTHGALTIRENKRLSIWSARRWRGLSPGREHHLNKLPEVDYTAEWIERFAVALAHDEPHEITGKEGWINTAGR